LLRLIAIFLSAADYYNEQKNAKAYLNFLDSSDGQIQQEFLYLAIKKELDILKPQKIIEAGCGSGERTPLSFIMPPFPMAIMTPSCGFSLLDVSAMTMPDADTNSFSRG
jgi:hypothetical protein